MPMAKSRRVTKSRTSARKPARVASKRASADRKRPKKTVAARSGAKTAAPKRPAPKAAPAAPVKAAKPVPAPAPPAPAAPPPRKPTYHEAVAMYERGLQALQRRDFAASAAALRNVIERYPDERELLERARLYLKVCERELEPKEPTPKTADEWVYAATVAQNSGDEPTALKHLQRALTEDPRHDHAHYLMAVAMAQRGDPGTALDHLRRAVSFNPENRSRARQDSDLDVLRDDPGFKTALETPPAEGAAPKPAADAAAAAVRTRKPRR
jgi:tetratricopeptide (TPR) repeat protein